MKLSSTEIKKYLTSNDSNFKRFKMHYTSKEILAIDAFNINKVDTFSYYGSYENLKNIVRHITPASIYELDYQAMSKDRTKIIFEELLSKALHPTRVFKWWDYYMEQGGKLENFDSLNT